MKLPSRVRLRDIAAEAAVSVNTVSRALNNKWDVSQETRKHVLGVAERLGYTPNILARSLVQRATRTLGLVVTDATHPYYMQIIRSVEKVTSEAGFALLLATSGSDPERERRAITLMRERCVDGILLAPVDVQQPHIATITKDHDTPVVLLTRWPEGYKGPLVTIDNETGSRLATRHLLDLGHRRIAMLTRSGADLNPRLRIAGWCYELKADGLACDEALIHPEEASIEGGRRGAQWLMDAQPRPTAIITYSDMQAIGVVMGLREAGIDVPGDVSVVGFDDVLLASLVTPALSTVSQRIHTIGTIGAEMLQAWLLGQPVEREQVFLDPEFVPRESSGRAPETVRRPARKRVGRMQV
ncbi:LacI family DNA-binding transcriptional regulator [Bosea sp. (in: a-proteobacteria)]|uniref:LacI family DNA-binding transcriptional regulator n=1 Tax=Bosea sp. (in: a-proteobacteria) TaxID=1871050 RepID=UPI002615FF2C|nr:LacI family DNA-binding transcriptional regulator [Bosea sp. (in: a-proteobacteria)]MCO5089556.1 LacI family transcriptional regulator [Bosea sp. (in: a-proteobacteria)]